MNKISREYEKICDLPFVNNIMVTNSRWSVMVNHIDTRKKTRCHYLYLYFIFVNKHI